MKIFLLKKFKQRSLDSYFAAIYHVRQRGDVVEVVVVVVGEVLVLLEVCEVFGGFLPVALAARKEACGLCAVDVMHQYVEVHRLVDACALGRAPPVEALALVAKLAELPPRQKPLSLDFRLYLAQPRHRFAVVLRPTHFAYEVDDVPVLRHLFWCERLAIRNLLFEFEGKASMHEPFDPCLVGVIGLCLHINYLCVVGAS